MEKQLTIRPPRKHDLIQWKPLWDAYCAFYEATVPEEVTKMTWGRILDPEIPFMGAYVATDGEHGDLLGFATWILHPATWSLGPRCYMEDLFVVPEERGQGIGKALIEVIVEQAKREKCGKVYWMTKADNAAARGLYDKLGKESGFVRYDVQLDPHDL